MKKLCFLIPVALLLFSCKDKDNPSGPGPGPNPTAPSWVSRAAMPNATQETTPIALNGKIYIVGGFDTSGRPSRQVQIYTPATNSWSTGAQLPRAMHHIGIAAANGKLYLLGGYSTNAAGDSAYYTPTNFAYEYDPSANSWTAKAPLPVARGAHVALTYQGKIYLLGGIDIINNGSPRNDIYDPATNTWSTGASLPTVRDHVSGVVLDSLLYVISGGSIHQNTKTVEAYSPVTNLWHTFPDILLERHAPAVGAVKGKIYLAGGETNSVSDTQESEVFNPQNRTWTVIASLPTARSHTAGAVVGDTLYVIGGSTPTGGGKGRVSGANEALIVP